MRRGPDFLGFGATRTATTYLHAQLRSHPGIWLPPKKEIYYFNKQRGRGFGNARHREYLPDFLPSVGRALRGAPDGWTDVAWGVRYLLGPRTDRWFLSLSPRLPGRVIGQVEPTYATLGEPVVRQLHELLPDLKLFFVMRDPIDRAWSTVTKQLARFHDRSLEEFPDERILDKIVRQGVPMSSYFEILARWESVFPPERIQTLFYEQILADPARAIDALCVHVGAGPHPALHAETLHRRVNDTLAHRSEIPPRFERELAERLAASTGRLAHRFGGPAERWQARIEAVLQRSG